MQSKQYAINSVFHQNAAIILFYFFFYLRDQDRLGYVEARRAAKAVLLVAHGGVVPNIDKSHDVI